MTRIARAEMRLIYDSRGNETVEARLTTDTGFTGHAGAPSGASTGTHEVRAFPEGGVAAALRVFASDVAPHLRGTDFPEPAAFDHELHVIDGTPDFHRMGGNPATALSVAMAEARAKEAGVPLWKLLARPGVTGERFPAIVGNCLNGGRHAIGGPDIQEFIAFSPEREPRDSVRAALAVHRAVGERLRARFPKLALGRGDEGGWVAPLGNTEALELLADSCATVRDRLRLEVYPGADFAASEFFRNGTYRYREQTLDPAGQVRFVTSLIERYDLRYVEDPFEQEAFDSFAELTHAVGDRTAIVGDDLYTTRRDRFERGVDARASNAILIKVNQVGTLADTTATVDLARANGVRTVTSHRSGDVPDGWLAHVAVAFGSYGIKCGLLGGERVAKLNELLRLGGAREDSSR